METTVQKESKRIKLLELKQVADDIIKHLKNIAAVLAKVKAEYITLNIGEFTKEIMMDFCKRGTVAIEEHFNTVLKESFKDLPPVLYGLITSPADKIRAQFGKYHEQIKSSVPGWGLEYSGSSTYEKTKFTALAKDYTLLNINIRGEIYLSDESIAKIVAETTFYAETKVQTKLLDIGSKIENLVGEATRLWLDSGLDKNTLISIPTDAFFEGLFEVDNENNFLFNKQAVRFIQ